MEEHATIIISDKEKQIFLSWFGAQELKQFVDTKGI